MLMLLFYTSMHTNSVLLLLLGLLLERALSWRQLLAYSATIQGFVHGFQH
jgi:hypothetical protein